MPTQTKLVQVGELGAVPASLMVDPALDFSVDSDGDGDPHNDPEDLLFIAGGHMGLWVMQANPTPGAENRVVRLDDRGALSSPIANQKSRRFCNLLAAGVIGPNEVLLATFGRKDKSLLRVYDLQAIRDLVAGGAPETGNEIVPMKQVSIDARPDPGGGGGPVDVSDELRFGAGYPLGMSIAPYSLPHTTGPWPAMDVFLALNTDGLIRVRLRPLFSFPLGGAPTISDEIGATKKWGPVFGADTAYVEADPVTGLNASGYPAAWYRDFEMYDPARTIRFNDLLRVDRPAFTDVVTEQVTEGTDSVTYVYAAVDHLNWCRFRVVDPPDWSDEMLIDHHEVGNAVSGPLEVTWAEIDDRPSTATITPQSNPYDGKDHIHIQPTNLDAIAIPPTSATLTPFNGYIYARRLELVPPPSGSGITGNVLVATYSAAPWVILSDVVAPRSSYTHNFYGVGGVPLELAGAEVYGWKSPATVIYDTGRLGQDNRPGEALASELANHEVGGGSLFVAPEQPPGTKLRVLHDGVSAVHTLLNDKFDPNDDEDIETSGACLSLFPLDVWAHGKPADFLQRNELDSNGRYTFSAGWAAADSRVIFTGVNDSQEMHHGGALYMATPGPGEAEIAPIGSSPPSGVFPNGTDGDRRMVLGLVPKDNNQWIEYSSPPPPATPEPLFNWFVGQAQDPRGVGQQNVIRWGLFKYAIDLNGPAPGIVDEVSTWFIDYATDRWGRTGRDGGYDSAVTTPQAYTDWVNATYTGAEARDTTALAFFGRAGTPDGIEVADRDALVFQAALSVASSTAPLPWLNAWSLGSLNCHPEYDFMPNELADGPIPFNQAKVWWSARSPVMNEQANSIGWGGRSVFFPDAASGVGKWCFASPCFYLGMHPDLPTQNRVGVPDVDAAEDDWFGAAAIPSSHQRLLDDFDHGLIQLWDISDPDNLQAGFQDTATEAAGDRLAFGYPEGSTTLPWIVLPDAGSAAWEIEPFSIETPGGTRVMLACADFGGSVLIFDITDAHTPGAPEPECVAQWNAPARYYDDVKYVGPSLGASSPNIGRRAGIVWSVAVDQTDPAEAVIYAGVHDYGVAVLTLHDQDPDPAVVDWEFDAARQVRVETAGNPFSVSIRQATPEAPKALLVSDGVGGLRLYVEED